MQPESSNIFWNPKSYLKPRDGVRQFASILAQIALVADEMDDTLPRNMEKTVSVSHAVRDDEFVSVFNRYAQRDLGIDFNNKYKCSWVQSILFMIPSILTSTVFHLEVADAWAKTDLGQRGAGLGVGDNEDV